MKTWYHSPMVTVKFSHPLPPDFYLAETRSIAKALLGKRLFRRTSGILLSGIVVETEAYLFDDPACHGFRGKTARNAPMFGPPGRTYVYFTYGVHDMLNIVTAPEGVGEAVLIRAAFPVDGIETMRCNRGRPNDPAHLLASGPGRLASAFGISNKTDNNIDVTDESSAIWIGAAEDVPAANVVETTRIGITKAAGMPWRYYIAGNMSVSRK